jgi:probable HAF family extracellular repeat protein
MNGWSNGVATFVLGALIASAISTQVRADTVYSVTEVAAGGATAIDLNNRSQVLVQGPAGAALYTGSSALSLPGRVSALNDLGQVVGTISDSRWVTGYVYDGTSVFELGAFGGTFYRDTLSAAIDINNAGQITGWARGQQFDPFVYDHGTWTDLGNLNGPDGAGIAINDRGEVVGEADDFPSTYHAFHYADGVLTDLGTLGGERSAANDINNRGQIVGTSDSASGEKRAFLYENGAMADLGTLGGTASAAYAINVRGDIVGSAGTAGGATHAFLYTGGVMRDLNDLIAPDSGWTILSAAAINDRGQIAATGIYRGATGTSALVLTAPAAPLPNAALTGLALLGGLAGARGAIRLRQSAGGKSCGRRVVAQAVARVAATRLSTPSTFAARCQ